MATDVPKLLKYQLLMPKGSLQAIISEIYHISIWQNLTTAWCYYILSHQGLCRFKLMIIERAENLTALMKSTIYVISHCV